MSGIGLILLGSFIYFLPTLNCFIRWGRPTKKNWRAIFLLNLLTGWTIIGWIVAAVWSETVDSPEKTP